jgi:hypothetical protein
MKMLKLLQESRALDDLSRAQFTSRPAAVYLTQLRPVSEANRSKRKLIVAIDARDFSRLPDSVSITHLPSCSIQRGSK